MQHFSPEDFKIWASRFLELNEIKDGGKTFAELGIHLVELMPWDLTAAEENVELQICTYIALLERARDQFDDLLDVYATELEQATDNMNRMRATIIRDVLNDNSIKWKKTDASMGAHADTHPDVIGLHEAVASVEAQIRETKAARRQAESSCKQLQRYHKSLEMHIRRLAAGIYYAVPANPRPDRPVPSQEAKEVLLDPEQLDDDDPRAGFSSWKQT